MAIVNNLRVAVELILAASGVSRGDKKKRDGGDKKGRQAGGGSRGGGGGEGGDAGDGDGDGGVAVTEAVAVASTRYFSALKAIVDAAPERFPVPGDDDT